MVEENNLKYRSYKYALQLIKLLDTLNKNDWSVQVISKQVLRSGTSIGANIAESQGGNSPKDFAVFLNHALKSANESKFWLGLLRDSHKANKDSVTRLLKETVEIANMLGASIRTVRKSFN